MWTWQCGRVYGASVDRYVERKWTGKWSGGKTGDVMSREAAASPGGPRQSPCATLPLGRNECGQAVWTGCVDVCGQGVWNGAVVMTSRGWAGCSLPGPPRRGQCATHPGAGNVCGQAVWTGCVDVCGRGVWNVCGRAMWTKRVCRDLCALVHEKRVRPSMCWKNASAPSRTGRRGRRSPRAQRRGPRALCAPPLSEPLTVVDGRGGRGGGQVVDRWWTWWWTGWRTQWRTGRRDPTGQACGANVRTARQKTRAPEILCLGARQTRF
jgi:hypothetical protein